MRGERRSWQWPGIIILCLTVTLFFGLFDTGLACERSLKNSKVFAFDYNGDGKKDLCFYRPGAGAIYILRSSGCQTFETVYAQGDGGCGIARYNLSSASDRVFPFDYNGDGRSDLCLYRPGTGAIFIVRSNGGGTFTSVYRQGNPGKGIAGYNLSSASDRVFPLDYNGDGKSDLCLYRPGAGAIYIARSNGDGTFSAVYRQGAPGYGIAGYSLRSSRDQVFPFDYNNDGRSDLCLYRPGAGAIYIARSNGDGTFTAVYRQGDPGSGIVGYDLKSSSDQVFPFDYNGDGYQDLCLYRPGAGAVSVVRSNGNGTFTSVYRQGDSDLGIAGFDLKNAADQVFACDHNGDGDDDLCIYIPETGVIAVIDSAVHL
jgi:hypothetical protein